MMIKNTFILVAMLFVIGFSTQAQNTVLQDSVPKTKKVDLIAASAVETGNSVSNAPLDDTNVQMIMSVVIVNWEEVDLEKHPIPISDKKPRLEMFSITKDSIEQKMILEKQI